MRILSWHGAEIMARVEAACVVAIDETTRDCVGWSKANHPWQNRTGDLEASLEAKPATKSGSRISGFWGSFTIPYAPYLEHGTDRMRPFPYLIPSAQVNYPKLAGRIKAGVR